MRFLVTRPQPECARTAERLRAAGHACDEAPLLVCVEDPPVRFDLSGVSALAFTSRRGVAVLAGHEQFLELKSLPVYTVGDATAEAAREAGFATVLSSDGDVAGLARLIGENRANLNSGGVLYPAAEQRSGDLDGLLAAAGIACRTVAVYRMRPTDRLPEGVVDALGNGAYDGVLIYSRRTAEVFGALVAGMGADHVFQEFRVFALSEQAGAPLSGRMRVQTAAAPNETALLDLALTQC